MRGVPVLMIVAVAACAPPLGTPHAVDPDGSATDATPVDGGPVDGTSDSNVAPDAASAVCGFDSLAVNWTLPPGAGPGGFGAFEGINTVGAFKTIDLDGDRRPDIVDLADFSDSAIGSTHWRRHTGGASGFATNGSTWSLPTSGGPYRYLNSDVAPTFDLIDMDGDTRPELVVTYRGSASPTVGTERWDVYRNDGNGFAASSSAWALPTGYAPNTFRSARASFLACPNAPAYELFDIDGDERPDLVVTDTCDASQATRWLVYRNNGTGFDASPTTWELRFPEHFDLCDVPGLVRFAHVDLDADHRPDLVITASCTSSDIGYTHWLVYLNVGTSFASVARAWPLPDGQAFDRVHRPTMPSYTTTDVDGDARPDLVVLSRTGTELGTTRWLVHHNTGTGFDQADDWCLPSGYGAGAFALASHEWCRTIQDTPAWSLIDLDADGTRELVIANDNCDSTSTAGTDHWYVHRH